MQTRQKFYLILVLIGFLGLFILKNKPVEEVKIDDEGEVKTYTVNPTPTFTNAQWDKSGHAVDPATTPLPTKNGWLRYSEYDPMEQTPLRNGGRKDVIVEVSKEEYEKVYPQTTEIYLAKYLAKDNTFDSQFYEEKIDGPTTEAVNNFYKKYNNADFRLGYTDTARNDFLDFISFQIANSNRENLSSNLFFNDSLILQFTYDYPQHLTDYYQKNNIWRVWTNLTIRLTGETQTAPVRSFEQFKSKLHEGVYTMFWMNFHGMPEFMYTPLSLDSRSKMVIKTVKKAYIAQSKGLIPAYLICGYQEMDVKDENRTEHYNVCGVTEAIDYGD